MIPTYVKVTLLILTCITLYLTRFMPGIKNFWTGISQRKYDTFVFCLLFISIVFLGGERTSSELIDTNRAMRIIVILTVIILAWNAILMRPAKVISIPVSIKFMLTYALAAIMTTTYSLLPSLTAWKSTEVIAHVSVAIMLAKGTNTLQDGQTVLNFVWLAMLFIVINTLLGALLFPDLAFLQNMQFRGMTSIFPRINLNTASQIGASMAVGALATLYNTKGVWSRVLLGVVTAAGVAVLILAHSRTSLLALAACIIVFAFYARSAMLKVMTIIGTVIIAIASTAVMTFMYRGQTEEQLTSLTGRTDLWVIVIEKIMGSPIFGYGYYSATRALFNIPGVDNTYLSVLMGGGIVLLAIFIIPIGIGSYQIYTSRPSKTRERGMGLYNSLWMQIAGLFIILLTRSLTGPSFDAHHIALMLFVLTLIGADCLYKNRNTILSTNTVATSIASENTSEQRARSKILSRRRNIKPIDKST